MGTNNFMGTNKVWGPVAGGAVLIHALAFGAHAVALEWAGNARDIASNGIIAPL